MFFFKIGLTDVRYLGNGHTYVRGVSQAYSQTGLGQFFKENPASIRSALFQFYGIALILIFFSYKLPHVEFLISSPVLFLHLSFYKFLSFQHFSK